MKDQDLHQSKLFSFTLIVILILIVMLPLYKSPKCQSAVDFFAPNLFCGMNDESSGFSFPFFPMQQDTLRALVVFCNFPSPSGNYEISGSSLLQYWPGASAQIKPSWADSIICPTTTNIWNRNLTGLFKDQVSEIFI